MSSFLSVYTNQRGKGTTHKNMLFVELDRLENSQPPTCLLSMLIVTLSFLGYL